MSVEADVGHEFETYWTQQKRQAIEQLSEEEGLDIEGLEKVIGNYLFTEKPPMRDCLAPCVWATDPGFL